MTSTRVWSLWEMLKRFHAREILGSYNYISQTQRLCMTYAQEMHPGATVPMLDEERQLPANLANLLLASVEYEIMGLRSAVEQALRTCAEIKDWNAVARSEVNGLNMVLFAAHNGFLNVTQDMNMFVLTKGAARYLEGDQLTFGDRVSEAFPNSVSDIQEASRCRAFERWTACVMHCMRALEPALLALAHKVGAKVTKENWHEVLKAIEAKIEEGKKAGKQSKLQFESEAATYFRDIKDGWRNHTMHSKTIFDEEGAASAYEATRSLLRHLSKHLTEPDPISQLIG